MHRREVRADLADVARVVAWADALAAAEALDDAVRYAIQVGLEESLGNLIVHGVAGPAGKALEVTFEAAAPEATVTVSDACAPFDITQVAAEPAEPIDEMPLGGLGLRLMRSFVSKMTYAQADERNVLTMVFRPQD